MKLVCFGLLFVFSAMPIACSQIPANIPNSPAPRSIYTPIYTNTFTPTISATPTITRSPTPTTTAAISTATPTATPSPTGSPVPTNTPNPSCPANGDVTANIDGADYLGDDTGHTLPASINLDQGGGSLTGDLLTFTVSSPTTLNVGVCATEDLSRTLVMYIRSNCTSTTGEFFNGGYCAGLPQIENAVLSPGTYYLIIAENINSGSDDFPSGATYDLRIKTGSVATAICTVEPSVTPVSIPAGTYKSCSSVYAFNGGAAASGERVATGNVDDISNNDDFYSFIPATSGTVTVTMDCFDNGMDNVDFDIYGASSCPTSGSPPLVGSSATLNPVEQFTFSGTAGTAYYIDVSAYLGGGPYRLLIQTP